MSFLNTFRSQIGLKPGLSLGFGTKITGLVEKRFSKSYWFHPIILKRRRRALLCFTTSDQRARLSLTRRHPLFSVAESADQKLSYEAVLPPNFILFSTFKTKTPASKIILFQYFSKYIFLKKVIIF